LSLQVRDLGVVVLPLQSPALLLLLVAALAVLLPWLVIPAKAGIQRLQRHPSKPSFPRTRESSDFSLVGIVVIGKAKVTGFPRSRE
jgi:hypothetical protein